MEPAGERTTLLVAAGGVLLLVIAAIFVFTHLCRGTPPQSGAYAISSKIDGAPDSGGLPSPDAAAIADAVKLAQSLQQAGSSPEQVENSIRDHNHGTATQGGSNQ
jgi:hypothetical protein